MKSQRAVRVIAKVSLLVALAATSSLLLLRTYLLDNDKVYRQGGITEVVQQGPVTIGQIQWKLDSLEVYTQLVNTDKKKVVLEQPAGSVVIVAKASVTALAGVKMTENGFSCSAKLRDDRGNVWKAQSPYGLAMPTDCSDSDFPFTRNKAGEVAQIFVVPESAVPHLSGIQVEDLSEYRRVLMTR